MERSLQDITNWRKSSRSSNGANDCVEVGATSAVVAVRDTKNRAGGTLVVSREAFSSFLMSIKAERL
ncbi:DUF397 domain-containing protein [Actinoalloteichus sp. AHMU CJ021]|uniref:DUF397 domain-containing protein n=2 Tax=Actinoalloteichus cyanogriseus TaxID=2893586 RepID=A0ABT1JKQ0_ACTCY|nr:MULTISPECIES: DUF397 domain-containing protein [Actinoalloteichus]AUS81673.1 DUF397 domain-containing protein [Actinoalloteichus sp. AHMU CJ021]MCP2333087.1 protein of unknown function (DUF397) [Actinoalloteichus caeruleus DSM 43889]